jgi:hypothetical protein
MSLGRIFPCPEARSHGMIRLAAAHPARNM